MAPSPTAQEAALGRNQLVALPLEVYMSIISYLPNSDIKNLRLTCSALSDSIHLRLDRVFLSVHRPDIDVFRAIASHKTLRQKVIEIIWDDSQFTSWPEEEVVKKNGRLVGVVTNVPYVEATGDRSGGVIPRCCPYWFMRACRRNIEDLASLKYDTAEEEELIEKIKAVSEQIPPWKSWEHFQEFLQHQKEVIKSEADVDAFKFGLERFSALKRVTIIPSAHDRLFIPFYKAPMIRSLPYAFNYPMPSGWPCSYEDESPVDAVPWDDNTSEIQKNQWRGFRVVTRGLAEQADKHRVSELIIDTGTFKTGVNYHIFNTACREQLDFATLLQQPGFSRLDLTLFVGGENDDVWLPFQHCLLHGALSKCSDLEHICFRTDRGIHATDSISMKHYTSLQSIFPVEKWPRLQHFALSSFPVVQSDLLALLAKLPPTLRSVELSQLIFLDDDGCYNSLLEQMRDTLGWGDRPANERPRVSFWVKKSSGMPMIYGYMESSVGRFLYGDGENPMGRGPGRGMYFSG